MCSWQCKSVPLALPPGAATEPLPLAARNVLAELMTESLLHAEHRVVLEAALGVAQGHSASGGAALAAASAALHAAGLETGSSWRATAVAKLRSYIDVAARGPLGGALVDRLAQAHHLFAAGLFFEVHEVLEPAWLEAQGDSKARLQGLIQAAVAWHHFEASNARGAASLARAASDKLRGSPAVWHGFGMEEVATAISRWADWLESGACGDAPERPFAQVDRR